MRGLKRVRTVLLGAAGLAFVTGLLLLGVGPQFAGYRTVTVLTGSMRPGMPEGSLAVQTPLPLERIAVGDVITYRIPVDDRRVVTHRVVEILEGGPQPVVRTRGDANEVDDPWVARLEGEQTWEVRAVLPKAGYVVQWLRSDTVQRVTLVLSPLVLCLLWLRAIWRPEGELPRPDGPGRRTEGPVGASPTPWTVGGLVALLLLGRLVARRRVA